MAALGSDNAANPWEGIVVRTREEEESGGERPPCEAEDEGEFDEEEGEDEGEVEEEEDEVVVKGIAGGPKGEVEAGSNEDESALLEGLDGEERIGEGMRGVYESKAFGWTSVSNKELAPEVGEEDNEVVEAKEEDDEDEGCPEPLPRFAKVLGC